MATHELKTDPDVFDAVAVGAKTHEIRLNDRDFKVGDELVLRRTVWTGEDMRAGAPLIYSDCPPERRTVSHVLTGYGLMPGWVILSFATLGVTTTLAPAELGHGLKTGTTETNTAGLPGMDGAAAAEKLREDTRMQGHCGICGALYPQHHAGCASGVKGSPHPTKA